MKFLRFWGFKILGGIFPHFGDRPPKFLMRQKTLINGIKQCKNEGAPSPHLGSGPPLNIFFDPKFYTIGLSKVFKALQPDQYLDAACNVEKNLGVIRCVSELQGHNFEILGSVNYTKFSPSWEDQSQIFLIR